MLGISNDVVRMFRDQRSFSIRLSSAEDVIDLQTLLDFSREIFPEVELSAITIRRSPDGKGIVVESAI